MTRRGDSDAKAAVPLASRGADPSVPLAAIIKPGRPRRKRQTDEWTVVPSARERPIEAATPPPVAVLPPVVATPPPLPVGEAIEATLEFEAPAIASTGIAALVPPDADPTWAADAVLSMASDYVKDLRTPGERAWYARVFEKEYLAAYPLRESPLEADFVRTALAVEPGARLLDLGCGYGRHALPLARAGFDIVGLDLSLPMLQKGLALAQEESLAIQFVHGDMRDLNFEDVFDGALCMDQSFGFFSEPENVLVLKGLHRSLRRGARFVLDLANRDSVIYETPNRTWFEGAGCLVQEDVEFDYALSRLLVRRFLVFADGKERIYDMSLRLYSAHEIQRMLDVAGFDVLEFAGSIHTPGAYFGCRSDRLIVTAVRR